MRVGFELTGLELDSSGPSRVAVRLRAELERRDDIDLVPVAQPGASLRGPFARARRGLARELVYLPFQLPRVVERLGVDLLHCPMGLAPVRGRVPVAITIHDVLAWQHPAWLTHGNVLQQRAVLARALRRAACVLTSSEYSRMSILERLQLDPARVTVVPLGIDGRFSPGEPSPAVLDRLGIRRPYILSVGTLQPRKNVESTVAAFERLARAGLGHRLVIAGARGWRDDSLLARLDRSSARDRIRLTGRVSDDDLVHLYRGADCFLFPSRYEGFGLPPLEAMACGTPVVCSNRTSLPEVVGEAAVLVDPEDVDALERALSEILSDPKWGRQLRERGIERAGRFTWSRCAERTVAAYELALAR